MPIRVLISGLPGKMASLVGKKITETKDIELLPYGLSGKEGEIQIGNVLVKYFPPSQHKEIIEKAKPDIIVDYTLPPAVNENAKLYCQCKVPFVMGTTGGDRELLKKTVEQSEISAVIAPNMAKPIVVFQAMMEYTAQTFPNAFQRWKLEIKESHQSTKADTSGTAKTMVKYFNQLGIPFNVEEIIKERSPENQLKMGVSKEYLSGHGWHTYSLTSPDGTVFLQFTHNVNGRNVYADGTLTAIRFLAKKKNEKGKVCSMIDVLKNI